MNASKRSDPRFQKKWAQAGALSAGTATRERMGAPRKFRFRFPQATPANVAIAAIEGAGLPVSGNGRDPDRQVKSVVYNDGKLTLYSK